MFKVQRGAYGAVQRSRLKVQYLNLPTLNIEQAKPWNFEPLINGDV
jgi:hypothetical protein